MSHPVSPSPPPHSLDHLILFLPVDPSTNLPSIPPIFTQNFTLTPGGVHSDNFTSNALIPLADGCYIELISFITQDSDAVAQHWWGPNRAVTGWKDWCLTNSETAEENWRSLGGEDGGFAAPAAGGRKRPDGVEVRWAVTFPGGEKGGQQSRGRVPFFCHDVTDRGVRVVVGHGKTDHGCGALGVGELTVVVRDQGVWEETKRVYSRIFGMDGVVQGEGVIFSLGRVQSVEGLADGVRVVLRLPRDEEEKERTEKTGVWFGDVVLLAKASEGKKKGTRRRLDEGETMGGLWVEYV